MQNFYYSIPTKIAFGKGEIQKLPAFIKELGDKALIVYGGGSIKRNGLLDTVTTLLNDNSISYWELSGVDPNPRITTVEDGVKICREHNIDVILPIGGGSTIDCAKAIAAAVFYEGPAWDIVLDNSLITKALPIVTVLTLAATGSEMDYFSVITNEETNDKMDIAHELLYPVYSIMDPEYTYTVPQYQTASGTADIMNHIFEIYFCEAGDTYMQDRIMEGLLKTCIKYGPIACREPDNYDARANLMWTSSWAINGFITAGKPSSWPCHAMEHQLSAYYDVTHGHGLAVLTPALMRYILSDKTVDKFATYGINVFGISASMDKYDIARKAIEATENVFREMGLTLTLKELGIPDKENFEAMAKKAAVGQDAAWFPLTVSDIIKIYDACYE